LLVAACGGNSASSDQSGSSDSGASNGHYSKVPNGPIIIGADLPLTGPLAPTGEVAGSGFGAFVQYVNDEGGIDGHQLKFVELDDGGDPTKAVANIQQFKEENAALLLNAGFGSVFPVAEPVAAKLKLPLFGSTEDDAYDVSKFPYSFTTLPTDAQSMTGLIDWTQRAGITRVGMLFDNTAFSSDLKKTWDAKSQDAGIKTVKTVTFDPTATDLTSQVGELKSANVQAVVMLASSGYDPAWTAFNQLNWTPVFIAPSTAYNFDQTFLGKLKGKAVGYCATAIQPGKQPTAGEQKVYQIYEKATKGLTVDMEYQVDFLDELEAFKAAVEKYDSVEPAAVTAGMESLKNVSFMSPNRTYTFSSTNHIGYTGPNQMCSLGGYGPDDYPLTADPANYRP